MLALKDAPAFKKISLPVSFRTIKVDPAGAVKTPEPTNISDRIGEEL
jgi:hypothetical protein